MDYYDEDFIEQMIHRKDKSVVNFTLIGINIFIFVILERISDTTNSSEMIKFGASYVPLIRNGEYYRLFTSMFLHFGASHLFSNMLTLFFLGDYMERYLGKIRYLILYLLGGLGGNVLSYAADVSKGNNVVSAGASGAVFAVLGGLAMTALLNKGHLYELSLKRILIYAALSIWTGFSSASVDGYAHLGGFLCGCLIAFLFDIANHQKTDET